MKKSRLPILLLIVAVVSFAVLAPFLRSALDGLAYPWAHPWTGKPALVGRWQGNLYVNGQTYPLTLEIERKPLKSHRKGTEGRMPKHGGFTGTAEWRDPQGRISRFEVSGRANRAASEVTLNLTATERPSSSAIQPVVHKLRGALEEDALRVGGEASYGIFEGGRETYPSDTPTATAKAALTRR
jgi:hypothetical protein